jgi:uncharacterized protein
MQQVHIGREKEQEVLRQALASNSPEFISVFGRRRVGKTFLIKHVYQAQIVFELTGLPSAGRKDQLRNFSIQLTNHAALPTPAAVPKDWLDAFFTLARYLDTLDQSQKKVVFFDEVPWLADRKSGFLMGLSWFWNSWAEMRNIVLVICGSATSWMIQKVVNDRGGLHNRLTKRVFLDPFTLTETKAFLESRDLRYNNFQIAQLYMVMGGIPHYLKEVQQGLSVTQNINQICFSPGGLLVDEFARLYQALFANADAHVSIIRALAQSHQGLTRPEIIRQSQLADNGNTSKILEELERSSFISSYYPFGKKIKEKLYRLTDEYSLFYLRFVEMHHSSKDPDTWTQLSQTQMVKTWFGYAFENLCLRHVPQLKKALGISGLYSQQSSWRHTPTDGEQAAQIDLLLDRADACIQLIEIKYAPDIYTIDKAYGVALRTKKHVFKEQTKTKKYILLTMITTHGVQKNEHYLGQVDSQVTLDELF